MEFKGCDVAIGIHRSMRKWQQRKTWTRQTWRGNCGIKNCEPIVASAIDRLPRFDREGDAVSAVAVGASLKGTIVQQSGLGKIVPAAEQNFLSAPPQMLGAGAPIAAPIQQQIDFSQIDHSRSQLGK